MDKELRAARERQLNELIDSTTGAMSPDQIKRVTDYLDHGEYALCLDQLAYELSEVGRPLPSVIIQKITTLGTAMRVDPRSWQDLTSE